MFLLVILDKVRVTVCDFEDESVEWLVGAIGELVIHRLISHIFAEHSRICSQTGNGHADIFIDLENFVLIAGEFGW